MVNLCNFSKSGEAVAVVLTDAKPPPHWISLCSLGAYPGKCFVGQANLEFTEIYLALPP